jgi:hypothetical protein
MQAWGRRASDAGKREEQAVKQKILICAAAFGLAIAGPFHAATNAKAPDTIEGLYKVPSKRFDSVYLLPGADFRPYTKIMFDTPEVAFKKNWQRDYNNDVAVGTTRRISDQDAQKILDAARSGVTDVFTKVHTEGGYQVVTSPGPDVLRVRTAVVNLDVVAPDTMTAGRSRTFSRDAGSATLIIEVRDSTTGALLGTAVDTRDIGDSMPYLRNSVTNRSDFNQAFERWAKISLAGLNELKQLSPFQVPAEK